MSLSRQIRRNITGRPARLKRGQVDMHAHAQATQGCDRYHARIFVHGTTISPAGLSGPTAKEKLQ